MKELRDEKVVSIEKTRLTPFGTGFSATSAASVPIGAELKAIDKPKYELKDIKIIKKDGTKEEYDIRKVVAAVKKSAARMLVEFSEDELRNISNFVDSNVLKMNLNEIEIFKMHCIVENALEVLNPKVAKSYRNYRNYKIDFVDMLDKVYQEILTSSEHVKAEDNIIYTLKIDEEVNAEKYGPILKNGYIDMILRNAFYIDGEIHWFDQEWMLECVPAKFIFFRMLVALYQTFFWVNKVVPVEEVAQKYDLVAPWNEFGLLENMFSDMVLERAHLIGSEVYRGQDRKACLR